MKNFWQNQRYYSLNAAMREKFGDKVIKLSLDGGFSCPNRDNNEGCIFCSESGSGDFAGNRQKSIAEQIKDQKELLNVKWPNGKYIAYFQNFTNTYGCVKHMRKVFYEALNEGVVGLAIATRADCISTEVLELLDELNKKTFLWIEIGAQSVNNMTIEWMNRGYAHEVLVEGVKKLQELGIRVCLHWIVGLPGEALNDHLAAMSFSNAMNVWGVKLHMLHVLKNTRLAEFYALYPFKLYSRDEYIDIVVEMLKRLDNKIVVHRMTGDGPKELLIEPRWILNKRAVLNGIDKKLKEDDVYQGIDNDKKVGQN